jgi:hypothetical protein
VTVGQNFIDVRSRSLRLGGTGSADHLSPSDKPQASGDATNPCSGPLAGPKLLALFLNCRQTQVTDLSPLRGIGLVDLYCDDAEHHADVIKSLRSLQKLNGAGVVR